MIIKIEGEKVTFDSKLTVEKRDNGSFFFSAPEATVEIESAKIEKKQPNKYLFNDAQPLKSIYNVPRQPTEPTHDPKHYKTSTNGLTVQESVGKAFDKIVDEIWHDMPDATIWASGSELSDSLKKLIVEGKGRDAAYAIAGGIKSRWKAGKYKGVPLVYVFKGIVDGNIKTEPKKVSALDYSSWDKLDLWR